jgi:hypothetical protein
MAMPRAQYGVLAVALAAITLGALAIPAAQGSVAGSVAQGSVAQGSVAQGSVAQGSVAQGSVADGSVADGTARAPAVRASVKFSARRGPVPHAAAVSAPALAPLSLPGGKTDTVLLWVGRGADDTFRISAQRAVSLTANTWSKPALVAGGQAMTDQEPAVAPFGPAGSGQVIATWTAPGATGAVEYAIGSAHGAGLSWGSVLKVPGAVSADAPAVLSLRHSNAVLVLWRNGTSRAIGYETGTYGKSGKLTWGKSGIIPGAETTSAPAAAEVETGQKAGVIVALWRVASGRIARAATRDPIATRPAWTKPVLLPADVVTAATPAAQAIGAGSDWPLLVTYVTATGTSLRYVTVSAAGAGSKPQAVPKLSSAAGPALAGGVLAATAPGSGKADIAGSGGIFYESVHLCAGC